MSMVTSDGQAPTRVETSPARRVGVLARLLIGAVELYRLTGAVRQPRCRFHPTCSSYAVRALRTHGAVRGGWLMLRRLLRCHPWNPGGVDHVPARTLS